MVVVAVGVGDCATQPAEEHRARGGSRHRAQLEKPSAVDEAGGVHVKRC